MTEWITDSDTDPTWNLGLSKWFFQSNEWFIHLFFSSSVFDSVNLSVTTKMFSSLMESVSVWLSESLGQDRDLSPFAQRFRMWISESFGRADSLISHWVNQCLNKWIFYSGPWFIPVCSLVQYLNQWIFLLQPKFTPLPFSESVFESVNLLGHFSLIQQISVLVMAEIHSYCVQWIRFWVNESFCHEWDLCLSHSVNPCSD